MPAADRYGYWLDNIERILVNVYTSDNPPYGRAVTAGAGRTAVMEAWGEHIGFLFADKRYGVDCFFSSLASFSRTKHQRRYIYRLIGLEQYDPNSNSPDAWIPVGVFWDLLDDGVHNLPSTSVNDIVQLGIVDPVIDNVQGVTNANIFSAITQNAPTEIITVRNAIKNDYPASSMDIDTLFMEYGY